MRISGIYKIENVLNHKVYIGQSKDILLRWQQHLKMSKRGKHYLYYSMNHDGINNFSFQILKETYDLDFWERFFIYWYKSYDSDFGYNLTTGGQRNSKRKDGFIFNDEMKSKMSESALKNWSDENYRIKIIALQNEGKSTKEARKNRSNATLNMWKTGKFKEQAKKISLKMMGVKKSEETKLKMKEASKLREEKHKQDFELYILNGGELDFNQFRKHYKKGKNDLMEE